MNRGYGGERNGAHGTRGIRSLWDMSRSSMSANEDERGVEGKGGIDCTYEQDQTFHIAYGKVEG
jgi:hypothetical protein